RGRRTFVNLEDPRLRAAVDVDAHGDPGRALLLQERYAQLLAAFDRLSPTLRTTVVLTQLQGFSHREAAVVLETTEGTISWRVHEARQKLTAHFEQFEDERTPPNALIRA